MPSLSFFQVYRRGSRGKQTLYSLQYAGSRGSLPALYEHTLSPVYSKAGGSPKVSKLLLVSLSVVSNVFLQVWFRKSHTLPSWSCKYTLWYTYIAFEVGYILLLKVSSSAFVIELAPVIRFCLPSFWTKKMMACFPQVYCIGGHGTSAEHLEVWVLDSALNKWTEILPASTHDTGASVFVKRFRHAAAGKRRTP